MIQSRQYRKLNAEIEDKILFWTLQGYNKVQIIKMIKAQFGLEVTRPTIAGVQRKYMQRHLQLMEDEQKRLQKELVNIKNLNAKNSMECIKIVNDILLEKLKRLKEKQSKKHLTLGEVSWLTRVKEILDRDLKFGVELSLSEKSVYDELHNMFIKTQEKKIKKEI